MIWSLRLHRLSASLAIVLLSATCAKAEVGQLSLQCSVLGEAIWPSNDISKPTHSLFGPYFPQTGQAGPTAQQPVAGEALWLGQYHDIQIDLGKETAIIDQFGAPAPKNDPSWGSIKVGAYPNAYSVYNVLANDHGDLAKVLRISINRHTRAFVWVVEYVDASDKIVGQSTADFGICDTATSKF
jgi:hypothetical protein